MKRRKVTALLMAAAMVLGTAACGNSGGSPEDKTGKTIHDKKESSQETGSKAIREITLLMTNDWVDESRNWARNSQKPSDSTRRNIPERRSHFRVPPSRISKNLSRRQRWRAAWADVVI